MVFSSLIFLYFFLPIFLVSYFIIKNRNWRNFILFVFSVFFYAYGEPIYSLLMLFSIFINYIFAIFIYNKKSKFIFILDILFNLGLLAFFKYFNFFIFNVNAISGLKINYLNISLPIGISFYTFQIITYIIDVYKGRVDVQKNIISLGCYICAFPQLIAGPIVRYSTVNRELGERKEDLSSFASGLKRFIVGLSKKVLIANGVAYICDNVMGVGLSRVGFIGTLIVALSYTIQIYFDFSGYSDMAIGLGKMLGFKYLENFDKPYTANSITDFWRRWHISLSSFFRDYIYIPLGGNRVKLPNQIRNLLIVWVLTGLWHGASWNFIIWGLYYGILLIFEKFVLKDKINKWPNIIRRLYSIVIVIFGWVIFMCTDLNDLKLFILSLFGKYGIGNINLIASTGTFTLRYMIPFVMGIILSLSNIKVYDMFCKNERVNNFIFIVLFLLSTIIILVDSYNPFIYFRF